MEIALPVADFLSRDIKSYTWDYQVCLIRKTAHRRGTLSVGSLPVERPIKRVSVDLVDHKTTCPALEGVRCKYGVFIVDYLTHFAVSSVALPNKSSETVARVPIERVIEGFGSPQVLYSDRY